METDFHALSLVAGVCREWRAIVERVRTSLETHHLTKIDVQTLCHLVHRHPRISRVRLQSADVELCSPATLSMLARSLPHLEQVHLHRTPFRDLQKRLPFQFSVNQLDLYMRRCPSVSRSGVASVVQHCKDIKEIALLYCSPYLSDQGLSGFASRCKKLKHLSLTSSSNITDVTLQALQKCRHLSHLGVYRSTPVSEAWFEDVAQACPLLEKLIVRDPSSSSTSQVSAREEQQQHRENSLQTPLMVDGSTSAGTGGREIAAPQLQQKVGRLPLVRSIDIRNSDVLVLNSLASDSLQSLTLRNIKDEEMKDALVSCVSSCPLLSELSIIDF